MKQMEALEALFDNLEELTPEKMEELVSQSLKAFEEIAHVMKEGSNEEKEKAKEEAGRLRDHLEKQAMKAIDQLKLSTEEFDAFTSNADNFTEEEWQALQKAKTELNAHKIQDLQKEMGSKVKKKKLKPVWVAG